MNKEYKTEVYEVQPHELMIGLVEVIRETQKNIGYFEMKEMTKDHLNKNSKKIIKRKAKKLSEAEIFALAAKLYTKLMMRGTIQALEALATYQAEAKGMNKQQFLKEGHDPSRLSRHIKATGVSRPPNVAAHAIVSGSHPEANAARKILAKFKIRIDDPDNGVYLPRDSRFIPHEEMPDAANHAKVHTDEYYINITNVLSTSTSAQECRVALKLIAKKLRDGSLGY
jgi:hypothetical protein